MKVATYFCFLMIIGGLSFAQTDSVKVKFVVVSNLSASDNVYITGNTAKLGNWTPDNTALQKINDSTCTLELFFPKNKTVEYKFTKGSWASEALNSDGTAPPNYKLKVENDTTLLYNILLWGESSGSKFNGQITGNVEFIRNLKTRKELLPRDVIIWLPPNYDDNINERYPVLYMNDGQNIIDPVTSFSGIDWQIDETADSLIKQDLMEPIIIVGVYNTKNRRKEYSENDTGYAYIDFLVNDLKPIIDNKYRTKPEAENTVIAGSSMGGLISFIAAWEYPDVFSKAACLSPALKIGKYNFVDNVQAYKGEKKKIQLYVDNGTVDLEDSLQSGIDEMLQTLKQNGYKECKDFIWFKDEGAAHNEAAWAERSWRFLKLFFTKGKAR